MRGGFRLGRDDDDLVDARRRLQAALAGSGVISEDPEHPPLYTLVVGAPSFEVGNADNAALSAVSHRLPPKVRLPRLSFLAAPTLGLLQELETHREARNLHASLLQEHQLAFRGSQLEDQLCAQARHRFSVLLQQEAETEAQIGRLQERRRHEQQVDLLLGVHGMPSGAVARRPAPITTTAAAAAAAAAQTNVLDRISGIATSDSLSFATAGPPSFSPPYPPSAGSPFHVPDAALRPSDFTSLKAAEVSGTTDKRNQFNVKVESLARKVLSPDSNRTKDLSSPMQQVNLPAARGQSSVAASQEHDGEEHYDDIKEAKEEEEEEDVSDEEYFHTNKNPREIQPKQQNGPKFRRTREPFPIKLYRILHEAEKNGQSDIIAFFPNGRAFAVHKSKEFTREIMPKYFAVGKMNTFLKQLNLYGFQRISYGPGKGGYFHPKFILGKRHLCKTMKRKKVCIKATPRTPGSLIPNGNLEEEEEKVSSISERRGLLLPTTNCK